MSSSIDADPSRRVLWSLAVFVAGYSIWHHNGLFFGWAGEVGPLDGADVADTVTPVVVIGPLVVAASALALSGRKWVVFGLGVAGLGHGAHLSSNAISNRIADVGSDATSVEIVDHVHLWDEVLGHWWWFGGLLVCIVVLVVAAAQVELGLASWVLAVFGGLVGLTWATNSLEGGTALLGLAGGVAAVVAAVRGHPWRWALAGLGVVACGVIGGWGVLHSGFPQPSSL